ncbi:unnamed protein product [Mytilus coruscus]|uniref:Uncharacterized protein n=1 Tax=Mytilus coruscus TaxID=42192 RepID=A0A6J8D6E8_MYTCO|nr:unnamed protein product [Mytilus coruscus]
MGMVITRIQENALTERGLDLYRANVNTHSKKIELVQTEVELCLERFSTTKQEDTNTFLYSDEYIKFLKNTKTEESLQVYEEHKIEDAKYKNILERALQQMKVSDKDEKESKFTHRSEAHSRTSSNSSSVAIRKRAKAEAAQAKLEFAMKEADLQKQKAYIEEQEKVASAKTFTKKAELEAELELLNYKKEAAAATAEADALEYDQNVCGSKKSDLHLSKTVYERTNQYVEQQVLQVKDVKLPPDDNIVPCDPFANQTSGDAVHEHSHMPTPKPSRPKYDVPSVSAGCNDNDINIQVQEHALNPNAPQFQPDISTHQNAPQIQPDISTHQNTPQFQPDISTHQNIATDLTRFLLKKDLLLSRLTTYSGINAPDDVNAYLTHLAPDGQASILQPCPYIYDGHECFGCGSVNYGVSQKKDNTNTSAIFRRTVQDDKSILSTEDRQFLTLMQTELQKDKRW